jgi:integrase
MTNGRRGSGEGSIHRRADGRYEARLNVGWVNGKRKRISVYGKTAREVQDKLRQKQNDRDGNVLVVDERLTVEQWLDHWVKVVLPNRVANETLSNSTYYSYADSVRRHIKPGIGKIRLTNLKAADVDRFLGEKRAHYSPNTLRIIRTTLRKAFRDGQRAEMVPLSARNAVELSEPVKVNRRANGYLDESQARRLLTQVKGDRLEAIYIVLLSLGLRRGEALGLYWDDVDLENRTVMIRRSLKRIRVLPLEDGSRPDGPTTRLELGSPKTSDSWRTQHLPQPCVDALLRHKAQQAKERLGATTWSNSDLVFTTPLGTMIDPSNLAKDFATQAAKAELGHRNLHQLRHSAATIMLAQGVPLHEVSRVLGHSTLSVTSDVYGHFAVERARLAADAIGDALWGRG